jgi:hypothetical protein
MQIFLHKCKDNFKRQMFANFARPQTDSAPGAVREVVPRPLYLWRHRPCKRAETRSCDFYYRCSHSKTPCRCRGARALCECCGNEKSDKSFFAVPHASSFDCSTVRRFVWIYTPPYLPLKKIIKTLAIRTGPGNVLIKSYITYKCKNIYIYLSKCTALRIW